MPAPMTGFPPVSEMDWRRLVERALNGRPFESLVTTTFEGLKIEPLYPRAEGPRPRALRQRPGPWKVSQRIDQPDPEAANAQARADLEGGADALTFAVFPARAGRGFGVRIESERDLEAALAGIDLDLLSLRLDAGSRALDLAPLFITLAERRRLTSAALDAGFGHDPIGHLAQSGTLLSSSGLGRVYKSLRDAGFAGHLLLADGRPYHEAGAGEAQELACVLATGIEYLRLLEKEGLSLEDARNQIAFLLAADAEEFLCLAKFRAMRRLWACAESACGLEPAAIRLHAETSFRMMTRYDPWANIFRTTAAAFAAAAGGADAITILPFTLALGLPDGAARRLARNAQLILVYEAKLAKVADPAAGSGVFEALTDELCVKAWSLFQSIEAQGGMIASLRSGVPQKEIAVAAAARREAIAHGKLSIIGTNAYPSLDELPVRVLAPAIPEECRSPNRDDCEPLPARRDAEPFEKLRAKAEEHCRKTGARPKIFLAGFGDRQDHAAAASFARNFFAAAGIESVESRGSQDLRLEFEQSRAKAACLCPAPLTPTQGLIEAARTLRQAGAAAIYCSGERHRFPQDAGIDELICAGCEAVAILNDALTVTLSERGR